MKQLVCPTCGNKYDKNSGYQYCMYDSTRLIDDTPAFSVGNSRLKRYIPVALLVVLIAGLGAYYFAFSHPSDVDTNEELVDSSAPSSDTVNTGTEDTDKQPDEKQKAIPVVGTLSDEYILPASGTEVYTLDSLSACTDDELHYARYELFARHGVLFDDEALARFFGTKTWYKPTQEERYAAAILNPIELTNFSTIRRAELLRGTAYATPFSSTRRKLHKAYLDVIHNAHEEHGEAQLRNNTGNYQELTGLCLVQMVDFDGDDKEELLLGWNDGSQDLSADEQGAYIEVWTYKDGRPELVLSGPADYTNGGYPFVNLYKQDRGYICEFKDYVLDGNGTSLMGTTVMTYRNDKSTILGRFQFQYGVPNPKYYVNDQEVSESEYTQRYQDVLSVNDLCQYWFAESSANDGETSQLVVNCDNVLAATKETIATISFSVGNKGGKKGAESTESSAAAQIADYRNRLDAIYAEQRSDARMGGTTMEMIDAGSEYSEKYTELLNTVYEYVISLPSADKSKIEESQIEWNALLEESQNSITEQYQGGSGVGPALAGNRMTWTYERIEKLLYIAEAISQGKTPDYL